MPILITYSLHRKEESNPKVLPSHCLAGKPNEPRWIFLYVGNKGVEPTQAVLQTENLPLVLTTHSVDNWTRTSN